MQCTTDDCETWQCLKSVVDECNLSGAEMQMLNKHEILFKGKKHESDRLGRWKEMHHGVGRFKC